MDISDEDLEKQIVIKPDVSVEDKLVVTKCLSKLGEDERQIVVLHAMSGLKHKDIAKLTELPLSTVLSKYNRALKNFKNIRKCIKPISCVRRICRNNLVGDD